MATRCYVDYLQNALASYLREDWGCQVLAPHPDGHVGIFASPTEKVRSPRVLPLPPSLPILTIYLYYLPLPLTLSRSF
jgi:hypothetical protein